MAFITSAFLRVQMIGLKKHIPMVQNIATILYMGKMVGGCVYMNVQRPKDKMTTMMWEVQVDKIFFFSSAL